jgi:CBS domain containing-hemolysin-like protein
VSSQPRWMLVLARFAKDRGWSPMICLAVSFVGVIVGFAAYSETTNEEVSATAAVLLAVLVWLISALFWLIAWSLYAVETNRGVGRRRRRARDSRVRVSEGDAPRWPSRRP